MSASASPEWVAECTAKEEESFDSAAEIDCRLREEEKERERVNGRTRKSKNVMPFLSPEHRLRPTGLLSPLPVLLHFFHLMSLSIVCGGSLYSTVQVTVRPVHPVQCPPMLVVVEIGRTSCRERV